ALPGDRRPRRADGDYRNNELAIFRMAYQDPQRTAVQGDAGSLNRPGPHHRDRNGELPVPQDHGQERRQGMMNKQWYYAQLRWAVMVEGKQGLREWKEAVHIFLGEDEQTAFQQALEIGRLGEDIHTEGR